MEDESKTNLSVKQLKKLIDQGEMPIEMGESVLSKISVDAAEISKLKKLKNKDSYVRGVKKLADKNKLHEAEIENQIALYDLVLQNKETFLKIIESDVGIKANNRPEKIRASGHYWDNKLRYSAPDKNGHQLTLFDVLEKEPTKEKLAKSSYIVSNMGINLAPAENKLVSALIKLLNDKSNIQNSKLENYYKGNADHPSLVKNYGGTGIDVTAPVIKFKPAELYKAYLDGHDYSGSEIKYIKNMVDELARRNFLISYERKRKVVRGGKEEILTDLIEDFQPLFKIIRYTPDLNEEELDSYKKNRQSSEKFEQKGEYLLALNPIFVDQIDQKYVEFPRDIEKRTNEAAGGAKKVTEADIALRDWILRELSNGRTYFEINEEKLPYTLKLNTYIRDCRKKLIKERIDRAIQVAKNLGILDKVVTEINRSGQPKLCFYLKNPFS